MSSENRRMDIMQCVYTPGIIKKKSMYLEAMPNIHLVMSNEENRKKGEKKRNLYLL